MGHSNTIAFSLGVSENRNLGCAEAKGEAHVRPSGPKCQMRLPGSMLGPLSGALSAARQFGHGGFSVGGGGPDAGSGESSA